MVKDKLPNIITKCKTYIRNILNGLDIDSDSRVFVVKSNTPKEVTATLDKMSIIEPDFYFVRNIESTQPLAYILLYDFSCEEKDISSIPHMSVSCNNNTVYFTEYDEEKGLYYYAQLMFKDINGVKDSLSRASCLYNYSLTPEIERVLMSTLKSKHDEEYDFDFEETDD